MQRGCRMEKIHLTELIDKNILRQIQEGFSDYTGMAVMVVDSDGIPVMEGSRFTNFCVNAAEGSKSACRTCESCNWKAVSPSLCDGKSSVYSCRAGFLNYAVPIVIQGNLLGSFLGGQVRTLDMEEECMRQKAAEMGFAPERFLDTARQLLVLSQNEVIRGVDFLKRIAGALSEMAYHNDQNLQESRKIGRAAHSQTDFILNLSRNMKKNMKEWMNCVQQMEDQADSQAQHKMKNLLLQGTEVYSMVEDVIEYIKMSEGKIELSENNYCIRKLLNQTVAGIKGCVPDIGTRIEIQIDENVPENMLGDSGRIGQIVNKLLINSVTHFPQGDIVIKAACQKVSYAAMLILSIEISSMELSEQQLKYIQEYMRNGSLHTLEREEGTELGLSLVSLLIRQMSGKIEVMCKEEGTVFTIILPQLEVKGGTAYGI